MLQITFSINGAIVPLTVFSVTGGSEGTPATCSASSSIKGLTDIGFDLAAVAKAASSPLPVSLYVSANSGAGQIFVGEFMTSTWEYANDKVTMHCRDLGGRMVDEMRVLAPSGGVGPSGLGPGSGGRGGGVQTQNQTVSQVVSQVAQAYGLTADTSNIQNDTTLGRYFGDEGTMVLTGVPISGWGFLTKLARDTGNEMYVTAGGTLVFGAPQSSGGGFNFTWRTPGATLNFEPGGANLSSIPLIHVDFEHNPSRNKDHTTTVNSYDPTTGEVITGEAVAGEGTHRYSFHSDGLTAEQATRRAEAISKDIAKREVICHGMCGLLPSIKPMQSATVSGEINPVFAGYRYYVEEFSHEFAIVGLQSDLFTQFTLLKAGD